MVELKMDPWQLDWIRKNLLELQSCTECDANLIAILRTNGVLSPADVEALNACKNAKGSSAQSSDLYRILETRVRGYEVLVNALSQCGQSGALKILVDGFRNEGITNPITKCNIQISSTKIMDADILFQGQKFKFSDIFTQLAVEDIAAVVQSSEAEYDYLDTFILGGKKPLVITENTVPASPPFYIPRSISNRLKVDPAIFKEDCPDIFIFQGIERIFLTDLANPNSTSISTDQLSHLTSRFILLQDEVDWDDLQELAASENVPAHFIRAENIKGNGVEVDSWNSYSYILAGTVGTSNVLWQHIKIQSDNNQAKISEDELAEKMDPQDDAPGFCICDTPGMGKSWLLANLARQMLQLHPQSFVVFLSLGRFIQSIRRTCEKSNVSYEQSLNVVLEQVSPSALSRSILLKSILSGHIKLELFLDGLDEVSSNDLDWTMRFLKTIGKNPQRTRLYVTSRTHLRRELEATLGVIAYDILPFTKANQVSYLVNSWKDKFPEGDEKKLETFANDCIQQLSKTITEQERDIMGIPLQCYLLAQVHFADACKFAHPRRTCKISGFKCASIYRMYKDYIEMKFSSTDGEAWDKDTLIEMKCYHVWKALQLLHPKLSDHYATVHNVNTVDPSGEHFFFGLLQQSGARSDTIEFVHRTVAEFLSSEYLTNALIARDTFGNQAQMEVDQFLLEYFVNTILHGRYKGHIQYNTDSVRFSYYAFSNPVVLFFLNEQLPCNPNNYVGQETASKFLNNMTPENSYRILQCSIVANFLNLFRYIKYTFSTLSQEFLLPFKHFFITKSLYAGYQKLPKRVKADQVSSPAWLLLCLACQNSNFEMTKECFTFIEQDLKHDMIGKCCHVPKTLITPLHWSLRKSNYELVEYILNKNMFTLEERSFLYECINYSYREPMEMVKKRIELCKLLLHKNKNLITESGKHGQRKYTGPLVAAFVHLELLKFLITNGADNGATRDVNNIKLNAVQCAAEYMSGDDFQELCSFLINKFNSAHLFERSNEDRQSPLHFILEKHKLNLSCLQLILESSRVNMNDLETDQSENLIFSAIRGNNSIPVLQELIKNGVDFQQVNRSGFSVLHLATERGNIDTVSYFLSLGSDVNFRDANQQTPLIIAFSNKKMVKHLLDNGADPAAADDNGNNVAHAAAGRSSQRYFHQLVSLLLENSHSDVFGLANLIGQTPLQLRLAETNHGISTETISLLSGIQGAHVNDQDYEGNNLLFLAIRSRQKTSLLKMLFSQGAEHKLLNYYGQSAANLAVEAQHVDALRYLLSLDPKGTVFDKTSLVELTVDRLKSIEFGNFRENVARFTKLMGILFILTSTEDRTESGSAQCQSMNGGEATEVNPHNTAPEDMQKEILREIMHSEDFQCLLLHVLKAGHAMKLPVSVSMRRAVPLENSACSGSLYRGVELLKHLIRLGLDLTTPDENGNTLMHSIPEFFNPKQYHDTSRFIIKMGMGHVFQIRNVKGEVPFHYAVYNMEPLPKTLKLLLDMQRSIEHRHATVTSYYRYVNVNSVDNEGDSILHWAVSGKRSLEFLKNLVKYGAEWSGEALSASGQQNLLRQNKKGATVLHLIPAYYWAKEYHRFVEYFIDSGYDRSFILKDNFNTTPLHCAVIHLEMLPETLVLLTSNNVLTTEDVNSVNNNGNSILHIAAAETRSLQFLQQLAKIGADLCGNVPRNTIFDNAPKTLMQDINGNTVLHLLPCNRSSKEFHQFVVYFIQQGFGSSFSIVNNVGWTSLHSAVYELTPLPETMDIICGTSVTRKDGIDAAEQFALVDINALDNNGRTVIHLAVQGERSLQFIKELVRRGAKLSANESENFYSNLNSASLIQDNDGDTVLHLATQCYSAEDFHEFVEYLIDQGLRNIFQTVNKKGETPLHQAVYHLELLPKTLDLAIDTRNGDLAGTRSVPTNPALNLVDRNGNSILHWAVKGNSSLGFIKELVMRGADLSSKDHIDCDIQPNILMQNNDGDTILHTMPKFYSAEEYHEFVDYIVGIGLEDTFRVTNKRDETPLHRAVYYLDLLPETLDILSDLNNKQNITSQANTRDKLCVDFNAVDVNDNSILHFAVKGGRDLQFLHELISRGASWEDEEGACTLKQNNTGDNVLHILPEFCSPEEYHSFIDYFIKLGYGDSFAVANDTGETPLHRAVFHLDILPKSLQLLTGPFHLARTKEIAAQSFVDLNAVDESGQSILHTAVKAKGSLGLIRHLVRLGADWKARCHQGNNLAHTSAAGLLVDHLKYFVRLGCDINEVNKDGHTVRECVPIEASGHKFEILCFLLSASRRQNF